LSTGEGKDKEQDKRRSNSADSLPRGTRLPDTWTLSPELLAWSLADAAERKHPSMSPAAVQRVAQSFADYWHAKPGANGRKLDWAATWRVWWRNTNLDRWDGPTDDPNRPGGILTRAI
jgi:hypothetical protein